MKLATSSKPPRDAEVFVRRIWGAVCGVLALTAVLIGRLVYLQVLHHDHYTTLSYENRLKIVPIAPSRGLIYSRDGVLLADNRPSFALEVIPEQVGNLPNAVANIRQFIGLE
ncbi:MAG: penicillin-binding protein 2, partial [Gammaproteobacteria bacterium]